MRLSPEELKRLKSIRSKLSKEDQEFLDRQQEELRNTAIRAAVPAVMARNFSHPLGMHIQRAK